MGFTKINWLKRVRPIFFTPTNSNFDSSHCESLVSLRNSTKIRGDMRKKFRRKIKIYKNEKNIFSIKTCSNLESVTNIDVKGSMIRWNRNPCSIIKTDLQARNAIRSQDRNHLWVSMLPKPY